MKLNLHFLIIFIGLLIFSDCQYFNLMSFKDWQDNTSSNPQKFLKYVSQISGYGLGNVHGVTIDSLGNIYVSDYGNSRVVKFNQNGDYLLQFGNGLLNGPKGIAIDDNDNIYVVDNGNNNVKKFDAGGKFISAIANGSFTDLTFAIFDKKGNLYITSYTGEKVFVVDNNGNYQHELGDSTIFTSTLSGITVDINGNIYVASDSTDKIFILDPNGNYLSSFTAVNPNGITVDDSGNIYDASNTGQTFFVYDKNRNLKLQIGGSASSTPGLFDQPVDVKIDSHRNVYIADFNNKRVEIFRWSSN